MAFDKKHGRPKVPMEDRIAGRIWRRWSSLVSSRENYRRSVRRRTRHDHAHPHPADRIGQLTTEASAQGRTIYSNDGRVVGRYTTDSQATTTVYDANGRVNSRAAGKHDGVSGQVIGDKPKGETLMTRAAFEQILERLQAKPVLPSFAFMHELGHAQLQLWRQIGGKAQRRSSASSGGRQ